MKEFESPTYFLDLRDGRNRSIIESAKPNKEVSVLVRTEHDPSAAPIVATGKLSEDGKDFHVVVVTPAGKQSHSLEWSDLQQKLRAFRDP